MRVVNQEKPKIQKFTIELTREEMLTLYGTVAHSPASLIKSNAMEDRGVAYCAADEELKKMLVESYEKFSDRMIVLYNEFMSALEQ